MKLPLKAIVPLLAVAARANEARPCLSGPL